MICVLRMMVVVGSATWLSYLARLCWSVMCFHKVVLCHDCHGLSEPCRPICSERLTLSEINSCANFSCHLKRQTNDTFCAKSFAHNSLGPTLPEVSAQVSCAPRVLAEKVSWSVLRLSAMISYVSPVLHPFISHRIWP